MKKCIKTLNINEMYEYGYFWDKMIPITDDTAKILFNEDIEIYGLYPDNTESVMYEYEDLIAHISYGGIFGIEIDTLTNLDISKDC